MEPILLYGHPLGSSLGLVAAFEWRGQPYRLCRVDMMSDMADPAYARLNPRRETPVLITDEGRPLTETLAITAWLEARDPERRISFAPLTPEADRLHQLLAFLNTGFTDAFGPLWLAQETADPDPSYQSALRRIGREAVIERHDRLEELAGVGPYLLGDHPTLADGVLAGVGRWLEHHGVADIARWPRLQALRKTIEADPAIIYALAIEEGQHSLGSGACKGHVDLSEVIKRFGRAAA